MIPGIKGCYRRHAGWFLKMLPRLRGHVPRDPASGLTVFVACDQVFLTEHAVALIKSLDFFAPGNIIHIHVVNPDRDSRELLDKLRRELQYTELFDSYEIVDFQDRSEDYVRTYYASIRFVRAYQLQRHSGRNLLILDADSLVRGPLRPLQILVQDVDVALRRRPEMAPTHRIMAGVLFVRGTKGGTTFLAAAAEKIAVKLIDGSAEWFLDQASLYAALKETQRPASMARLLRRETRPRIGILPEEYLDWEFRPDTIIWTGKGPRKDTDAKFIALRDKMLTST